MWRNPQKKEIFDKAVALRIKGKTYKYIADELGLSDTTIYKWLNYK
jgi:DNA invertase Pin-like site-specific DNA recombinase